MAAIPVRTFRLNDGRELESTVRTYPIPLEDQVHLIRLWQTEWRKTDLDWLESMGGSYSEHLTIRSAVGSVDGRVVATASVLYPPRDPEVAVLGNVLTDPEFRRLGIAAHLTNQVVQLACDVGCKACFLGTTPKPRCVYVHCGFEWWKGGVMRRFVTDADDFESRYFAVGQPTSVREANWGDLPGTTCLAIQPLESLVLDYPRSLLSCKYVDLHRCVSNFPALWYEVSERGGAMCVLIGETAHRILGFGTITPGPAKGQSHKAVMDVMTHRNYEHEADRLIRHLLHKADQFNIKSVQAYVASRDVTKQRWFESVGMRHVTTLPGQIRAADESVDVTVLEHDVQ